MKKILQIIFCFFTLLSFGQQTYKVTEGELQFILPGKGIILKKDNQLFEMKLNIVFEKMKMSIKTKLKPISEESLIKNSEAKSFVSYNEIKESYDFKPLEKISFNYIDRFKPDDKDYEEYKLYLINKNFFALFRDRHEGTNTYTNIEDYMPYILIQFNNKKIIYIYKNEEIFIIPTDKSFKIIHENDTYNRNFKSEKLKINNSEIYNFAQHAFYNLKDDFFRIDTLDNHKVILKNIYNEALINQSFDSIQLSQIIKCYDKDKIDLYNLSFKKLNKFPLKDLMMNSGSIQILENNKVKYIDWTGKKLKKTLNYPIILLPEAFRQEYHYELTISKKETNFVLKVRNMNYFGYEYEETRNDSLSLINTKNIKSFYFQSNNSKDTISNYSEFYETDLKLKITDLVSFDYDLVHYLNKNETYGMNYLGYFIKPDFENGKDTNVEFKELQNLQSIEYKYPFYKLKNNNLYKLYPLQKEYRYKKLYDFEGNFARFELPNGKKGWLSSDGIEYFDE